MADVVPPLNAPSEPLLSTGIVVSLVSSAIAVAVAFGVPLSDAQTNAILTFISFAAPLATAWFGRSKVYAPATVARLVHNARAKG